MDGVQPQRCIAAFLFERTHGLSRVGRKTESLDQRK
jgi:hypothetical protein